MRSRITRRGAIRTGALVGVAALAGCSDDGAGDGPDGPSDDRTTMDRTSERTSRSSTETTGTPSERVDVTLVDADPESGFHFPYFLSAPPTSTAVERPLLVQSNNTGTSTDDVAAHREAARDAISRGGTPRELGEALSIPVLVPVFPRPRSGDVNWRHDPQQLDTNVMHITEGEFARVDRQLLEMVADARRRLRERSYPVDDGLHLNGFSASGLFANRFTALHPAEVDCVTAGGINGHPILPVAEAKGHALNYQIGIADLESLVGDPFDRDAFVEVSQFLYMGAEDENDTFEYRDAWSEDQVEIARDVYGEDMVEDRFSYARSVYEDVGADATFRVFEGVGHEVPQQVREAVLAFHERNLDDRLRSRPRE